MDQNKLDTFEFEFSLRCRVRFTSNDDSYRSAELLAHQRSIESGNLKSFLITNHNDWQIIEKGEVPFPFGLRDLEPELAKALVFNDPPLWIKSETISTSIAELLVTHHSGGLDFTGLQEIPLDVAKILGRFKTCCGVSGSMDFDHVTELSDEVAEALAKCECSLSFQGLKTLSEKAATALSQHTYILWLDAPQMTEAAAIALARHRSISIHTDKLQGISESTKLLLEQSNDRAAARND